MYLSLRSSWYMNSFACFFVSVFCFSRRVRSVFMYFWTMQVTLNLNSSFCRLVFLGFSISYIFTMLSWFRRRMILIFRSVCFMLRALFRAIFFTVIFRYVLLFTVDSISLLTSKFRGWKLTKRLSRLYLQILAMQSFFSVIVGLVVRGCSNDEGVVTKV